MDKKRRRPLKIDITEIMIAMDSNDLLETYFDLRTGGIVLYNKVDEVYWGLGDDSLTSEEIQDLIDKEGWNFMLEIPQIPSHESYKLMEEFITTVSSPSFQERLWRTIQGKGAFRRFKDTLLEKLDEWERWFTFHDQWLERKAKIWLKENGISTTKE